MSALEEIIKKDEFTGIECCILWTYYDYENGGNRAAKENAENAAAELDRMTAVIEAARELMKSSPMIGNKDMDKLQDALAELDGAK